MTVTYTVGDTREVIKGIADGSVDLIASSPPFLALRSYVPADHESKGDEIGSEKSPAEFIDMLLGLTAEWGRVLAPHGSIAIELGDTYSGSGGAGGDYNEGGLRVGQPGFTGSALRSRKAQPFENALYTENDLPPRNGRRNRPADVASGILAPTSRPGPEGRDKIPGWPLAKSLALIPQLYAVALAYGINPLTGQPSPAGRLLVRNVIVWHRPNPAVGALGDKVRPSTSYIVVATRSPRRWFDLSAVRSGGADSFRPTVAAVASVPDAQEVATTFGARSRNPARGWCQPGSSKIALDPSVTWHTQRLQVVEPIGFLVGVEQHERAQMMDLQSLARPADLTLVAVTAQRILAGDWPVTTPVGGAPTLEAGMVIASDVDGPPLPRTLEAAEVVSQRLTSVAGHWLAAEITLKINGADATAYAIAPVGGSVPHTNQFISNHAGQGVKPKPSSRGMTEFERNSALGKARKGTIGMDRHPAGAPPLDAWFDPYDYRHDTWTLTTQPSKIAHYAMWPAKLAERLILSMCPREVCRICGEPRRRVEERDTAAMMLGARSVQVKGGTREERGGRITPQHNGFHIDARLTTTIGWTDCGCQCPKCGDGKEVFVGEPHHRPDCDCLWDETPCAQTVEPCPDCLAGNYRPGLTLDPFAGTGTTLAVADLHGRDAIGIDFDARNKAIYPARYDEVKKALFGTPAPMPGQGDLFSDAI